MGILEPITHSEETQQYLAAAEDIFNTSKNRYERSSKKANEDIESLGAKELSAWGKDIHQYINTFALFANAEESKYSQEDSKLITCNDSNQSLTLVMKNNSLNANEILKLGALTVGASAIAGIAAYGAVSTVAAASAAKTGLVISSATKGLLIGGAVVAPLLIFGAVFANIQGKKKLAEAKNIYAEAEKKAADLDVVSVQLEAISSMSKKYNKLIDKMSEFMQIYISKMNNMHQAYPKNVYGKVEYNVLEEADKKELHIAWLLACTYSTLLKCPIVGRNGKVNKKAENNLISCQHDFNLIKQQIPKQKQTKHIKTIGLVFVAIFGFLFAIAALVLIFLFLM